MSSISLVFCIYYFHHVFFLGHVYLVTVSNWVDLGFLNIDYRFIIDPLSITFGLLISLITLLILIYSVDYLHDDPQIVKFFAYLSFFSFSMSTLVFAGNFIIMFVGWEAVGLASYLLINFWITRNQANQAAVKAIIFNRIGDIAFILSLGLIFYLFNSLDLQDIKLLIPLYENTTINLFSFNVPAIELIAGSLFFAAVAKSAQLFLHPWLPDAMEGPTPVSALLHSATMVTAGIFLILRSSVIFSNAPIISLFIALLGLITANLSSLTGLLQYDIKRIIAFSTCSQLGYMMFAAGIGNYTFALFHLVNHAFFKALLFLCAGSVIHAVGQQDIRKMEPYLFKHLPLTYITMLFASLSLIGFPFLSGFYSKDFLLESTYNIFGSFSYIVFIISILSTTISSFYSFRLIYFCFFRKKKPSNYTIMESSLFLTIPLIILALLSIFAGYTLKDLMILNTTFYDFGPSPFNNIMTDQDFFNDILKALPTMFSLIGVYLVFKVYNDTYYSTYYYNYILLPSLSCKKFFFDAFNNFYIFLSSVNFSLYVSYKLIDQGFLEYFGPNTYNFLDVIFKSFTIIESTLIIYRSFLFVMFCLGALLVILFGTSILTLLILLPVSFLFFRKFS